MKNTTRLNNNFWEGVTKKTWNLTPYPWRPGYRDILFFIIPILRNIYRRKKIRVLLIGATKELRDILSLLSIHYDLIDSSENMVHLTTPLNDSSLGEIFTQDWFTEIPKNKKYNIIFGDLILNLLEEKRVSPLFQMYSEYLVKGGKFIIRTRIKTTTSIEKSITLVQEQLEKLGSESIYSTFANLQTIDTFSSGQSEIILSNFIANEKDAKKKELANLILNKYLHSGLAYYVHSKEMLLCGLDKKITIKHENRPEGYLDSFAFLEYKKY